MAGRLSPTGGKIGGTPGKTAPRIPGPVNPAAVKPALTAKAAPLRTLLNSRRGVRQVRLPAPHTDEGHEGDDMSERDYLIEKAVGGSLKHVAAARKVKQIYNDPGFRRRLTRNIEVGRESQRRIGIPPIGEGGATANMITRMIRGRSCDLHLCRRPRGLALGRGPVPHW